MHPQIFFGGVHLWCSGLISVSASKDYILPSLGTIYDDRDETELATCKATIHPTDCPVSPAPQILI